MDDLIERARALAPELAKRAEFTERERRLPDETIADLEPFLGVLETSGLGALNRVSRELAAACASTGWVAALYSLHGWMAGFFPEQEPIGRLVTFVSAPTGMADEVDGGHLLSGRWSWCSGIAHAEWVMVVGIAPEPRLFLLPRKDVTVHDVWFTSGMRGTGSNDVEIVDAFVPHHRSVPLADVVGGAERWPLVSVLVLAGAAPVLGAAEGLLARFAERLRVRTTSYGGAVQASLASGQMRLAKATADLTAARLMLDDAVAHLTATYESGGRYDRPDRARARMTGAHVVGLARGVVNDLCAASGASAQFTHSPFQRVQRDVNTISGHVVFDLDAAYTVFGKAALGVELEATVMI